MAGWIVAAAIYAVAALWVPITLAMANRDPKLRRRWSFWKGCVMPVIYMIFWPITLVVALVEWMVFG